MKFLIDAMLPPQVAVQLDVAGHTAVSPMSLGDQELTDKALIELSESEGLVLVTENVKDFSAVTTCTILFVLKEWWPSPARA